MGISTVLTAAAKHIPWGQVADMALQHGPDFLRKLKERLQMTPVAEDAAAVPVDEPAERIRELEDALVKQEEIIEQQSRNIEILEEIGKTLQARVNIFMAVSALSLILSLVMVVLLLRK
ncbi:MAG TPA: hypothetical protein VI389_02380 [Geobacteraceae bacterium]